MAEVVPRQLLVKLVGSKVDLRVVVLLSWRVPYAEVGTEAKMLLGAHASMETFR